MELFLKDFVHKVQLNSKILEKHFLIYIYELILPDKLIV